MMQVVAPSSIQSHLNSVGGHDAAAAKPVVMADDPDPEPRILLKGEGEAAQPHQTLATKFGQHLREWIKAIPKVLSSTQTLGRRAQHGRLSFSRRREPGNARVTLDSPGGRGKLPVGVKLDCGDGAAVSDRRVSLVVPPVDRRTQAGHKGRSKQRRQLSPRSTHESKVRPQFRQPWNSVSSGAGYNIEKRKRHVSRVTKQRMSVLRLCRLPASRMPQLSLEKYRYQVGCPRHPLAAANRNCPTKSSLALVPVKPGNSVFQIKPPKARSKSPARQASSSKSGPEVHQTKRSCKLAKLTKSGPVVLQTQASPRSAFSQTWAKRPVLQTKSSSAVVQKPALMPAVTTKSLTAIRPVKTEVARNQTKAFTPALLPNSGSAVYQQTSPMPSALTKSGSSLSQNKDASPKKSGTVLVEYKKPQAIFGHIRNKQSFWSNPPGANVAPSRLKTFSFDDLNPMSGNEKFGIDLEARDSRLYLSPSQAYRPGQASSLLPLPAARLRSRRVTRQKSNPFIPTASRVAAMPKLTWKPHQSIQTSENCATKAGSEAFLPLPAVPVAQTKSQRSVINCLQPRGSRSSPSQMNTLEKLLGSEEGQPPLLTIHALSNMNANSSDPGSVEKSQSDGQNVATVPEMPQTPGKESFKSRFKLRSTSLSGVRTKNNTAVIPVDLSMYQTPSRRVSTFLTKPTFRVYVREGIEQTLPNVIDQSSPFIAGTHRWRWQVFSDWCLTHGSDPFRANVLQVRDFLTSLHQTEGRSVMALTKFLRAVARVLMDQCGEDISKDIDVKSLVKRTSRVARRTLDHSRMWDLTVVLEAFQRPPFEPLERVSLKMLTLKTAFLVALAYGPRCGEVHAIDAYTLQHHRDWLWVKCKPLYPFFDENNATPWTNSAYTIRALPIDHADIAARCLCPVRALGVYRERIHGNRRGRMRLFIPMANDCEDEINDGVFVSWLQKTILTAYQSCDAVVKRNGAACSLQFSAYWHPSISISEIFLSCFWKKHSTFTAFYLRHLAVRTGDHYVLAPWSLTEDDNQEN